MFFFWSCWVICSKILQNLYLNKKYMLNWILTPRTPCYSSRNQKTYQIVIQISGKQYHNVPWLYLQAITKIIKISEFKFGFSWSIILCCLENTILRFRSKMFNSYLQRAGPGRRADILQVWFNLKLSIFHAIQNLIFKGRLLVNSSEINMSFCIFYYSGNRVFQS